MQRDGDDPAVTPPARRLSRPKDTSMDKLKGSAKRPAPGAVLAAAALAAAFVWAYYPTLERLLLAWRDQPDYSHGFFVVPVAIFILWARRANFPGLSGGLAWGGLGLLALSVLVRMLGAFYYLDAADGWSILFWVGGAVWFLCGWRVFWWSLPAVLFLWFMVPLPFRMEHALSRPMQHVATAASAWVLQCLGQPALAENNVLLLGNQRIGIEEACSGLRIFVGIVALAFVFVVLVRRTWWEKAILLASVLPVALVANVTRIVATSLLMQWFDSASAHQRIHDWAGYVMIPFAAVLFALVLWYLGALIRTGEVTDAGEAAIHQLAEA
jgi:exosortase